MLESFSKLLFRSVRMSTSDAHKFTNRLAQERSPYLLQHKHNPIQWYPWGEEAFAKAKAENRPIFLSVGYSTCHWCHVMERESFENDRIAKILNENFVAIKVDREERPDVDRLYMSFVQATTGSGGWPMSVFLTPDLEPFFGGNYFPPDDNFGRTGFGSLLRIVSDKWKNDTEALRTQGKVVMRALAKAAAPGDHPPVDSAVKQCFQYLCKGYDKEYGGFGLAPKFPKAVDLNYLLSHMEWGDNQAEKKVARSMLEHTLKAMAMGGIHDHIGKGFHRYSVDEEWHVPHFEKMLYDQTQLLAVYSDFSLATGGVMKCVVQDIADYMIRFLRHEEGGFYAAEDADSLPTHEDTHKKEGAFCVWKKSEIEELLKDVPAVKGHPAVNVFCDYFDVQENGNVNPMHDPHHELKGVNVLRCKIDDVELAKRMTIPIEDFRKLIQDCKDILLPYRLKRPPPHLDSKMVTAWQGLAISGFSKAAASLNNPEFLKIATKCAEFVQTYCTDQDGRLIRGVYRNDDGGIVKLETTVPAFSDDYAYVIQGFMDLYFYSGEEKWLQRAYELQEVMDSFFFDRENGTGYYISQEEGHNGAKVRLQEDQDGAEPCTNSVAICNLGKMAQIVSNKELTERAEKILKGHSQGLQRFPFVLTKMVVGFKALEDGYQRIVIVGRPNDTLTKSFKSQILGTHNWNRIVLYVNPDNKNSWLLSKSPEYAHMMEAESPRVFICKGNSCSLPLKNEAELKEALENN